jgi:hypothetical protein
MKHTDETPSWGLLPSRERDRVLTMLRKVCSDADALIQRFQGEDPALVSDLKAYALALDAAIAHLVGGSNGASN